MKLFFNLGLGYYLAKFDLNHHWILDFVFDWAATTSGGGLGFHGGLELEFDLSPMFGLIAELRGRFASFNNFEGELDWTTLGYNVTTAFEGPLWAGDFEVGTFGPYTLLWLDETEPALDGVRKAKVDFSGFSFVIGFIVHF